MLMIIASFARERAHAAPAWRRRATWASQGDLGAVGGLLAEAVGFEPTKGLTPCRFSRPVQSTTLPRFLMPQCTAEAAIRPPGKHSTRRKRDLP